MAVTMSCSNMKSIQLDMLCIAYGQCIHSHKILFRTIKCKKHAYKWGKTSRSKGNTFKM